jgi:hypothetical protein
MDEGRKRVFIFTMKIACLILASTIPLFAYQAKLAGTKDGSTNDAAKSTAKESKELNIPTQSAPQNPPNSAPSKEPSQTITNSSPTDPPDWINYVNAWSTLVIAFFTALLFIGLVIQIRTSRAIERAWIMAEIQPDPEKPSNGRLQVFETNGTDGENTAAMNAVLNCSNAGKTPGWIEETIAKFEMVKTLPDTPNFESAQSIQRSTIPEEQFPILRKSSGHRLPRDTRTQTKWP